MGKLIEIELGLRRGMCIWLSLFLDLTKPDNITGVVVVLYPTSKVDFRVM